MHHKRVFVGFIPKQRFPNYMSRKFDNIEMKRSGVVMEETQEYRYKVSVVTAVYNVEE